MVLAAMVAAGCRGNGSHLPALAPAPPVAEDSVAVALFLVGDAGDPHPGTEPVLAALTHDAARFGPRGVVLYLGDNLYPHGLPDAADPWRAEGERRLAAQVDAALAAGARAVFVPGNHDWDLGWDAVRRQEAYLEGRGGTRVVFVPSGGCPGPEAVDVGARLRIVALDTQWWLDTRPRPTDASWGCPTWTKGAVTDSLRATVRAAGGRTVIVAAHHPIESGGKHGATFGWKDHLFPLRGLAGWLWIPLPVVGSVYPLVKQLGVSRQDLTSGVYRELRDSLRAAFADAPPLAYAAGHEHNLQVIEREGLPYLLVSGSGIFGHVSTVYKIRGSRLARTASGYMRVEILRDGRARLSVVEVDADGQTTDVLAMWLVEG